MFFAGILDSILELAAIVGELLGHFVDSARHIAIDCGPEHHGFTDSEFVCGHRAPPRPQQRGSPWRDSCAGTSSERPDPRCQARAGT
jgi:hypothetical protein